MAHDFNNLLTVILGGLDTIRRQLPKLPASPDTERIERSHGRPPPRRRGQAPPPRIKVLFTTGYTRNAIVHNGRLDPGVDPIGKLFSFETLAAKVREILDRRLWTGLGGQRIIACVASASERTSKDAAMLMKIALMLPDLPSAIAVAAPLPEPGR